jgi:hypothetical protein
LAQTTIEAPIELAAPEPVFRRPLRLRWIVLVTVLVALAVRLPYFVNLAVPLNDGGMFAQIVDELRANGLRLPTRTNYNFLDLPLSYPPLGFYAAAIVGNLTGLPSVEVLKWLPLLFNLASAVAFVPLAGRFVRNRTAVACASVVFAILPQSGGWLIMGGGLTRSLGFLFSILAMIAAYDALNRNRRRDVVMTGLFAALAGLAHLESGTLVCMVLPLFALYYGPVWPSVRRLAPAVGIALLVALPWLLWLRVNVGLEPLRYASQTGGAVAPMKSLVGMLEGKILTDRFMGLGVLLLPAMLWTFLRRRWLLTVWIVVIMILVARSAYTQVTVPACLLLGDTWAGLTAWVATRRNWPFLSRPRVVVSLWTTGMIGLAIWTGIDKYIYGYPLPAFKFDVLGRVSPAERRAMEWCRTHTPSDARFLVLSERMDTWYMDMTGEWFPYFAQRHSVLTVQGREWRPNREFKQWQNYLEGVALLPQLRQVDALMTKAGLEYDHVFISGPFYNPRANLARQIARSPRFELLYEKGTLRIYRAKRPPALRGTGERA